MPKSILSFFAAFFAMLFFAAALFGAARADDAASRQNGDWNTGVAATGVAAADERFSRRLARKLADGEAIFGNRALAAFARGASGGRDGLGDIAGRGFAAYKSGVGLHFSQSLFAAVEESVGFAIADSFIKNVELSADSGLYSPYRASAQALAALWESERGLIFSEFGGGLEGGDFTANAGLGVRAPLSPRIFAGGGVSYDFLRGEHGNLRRGVISAELRSERLDLSANLYRRLGDEHRIGGDKIRYTANGWDVEAAGLFQEVLFKDMELAARYYRWERKNGDTDISGLSFRFAVGVQNGKGEFELDADEGVRFRFEYAIGGSGAAPSKSFFAARRTGDLWARRYEKTRREYGQRTIEETVAPADNLPPSPPPPPANNAPTAPAARTFSAEPGATDAASVIDDLPSPLGFTDPDGDTLTCTAVGPLPGDPGDLSVTGCTLSGTYPDTTGAPVLITVSASDGEAAVEAIFTLNRTPTVETGNSDKFPTIVAGTMSDYTRNHADGFTDADGETLTCELRNVLDGWFKNSATFAPGGCMLTINGTPPTEADIPATYDVIATDGDAESATKTYSLVGSS